MNGKYDDIIVLPHHRSATRPHMSMADRAAQFSPFAALTGRDRSARRPAAPEGAEPDLPSPFPEDEP